LSESGMPPSISELASAELAARALPTAELASDR